MTVAPAEPGWKRTARRALPCLRPVLLANPSTGELLEVRCKDRRVSRCPSCAALYHGDAANILRTGALDFGARRFVWLTLTAPSFGATHRVPKSGGDATVSRRRDGRGRPCGCGVVHGEADGHLRGVPLDPETYDYESQVRWNAHVGPLWHRTRDAISAVLGATLEFARVVEWQHRGAVHLHVLFRVPDGIDLGELADGKVCRSMRVEQACQTVGTWERRDGMSRRYGWGRVGIVAEVVQVRAGDTRAVRRLCGYMAKLCNYAGKDLGSSVPGRAVSVELREHLGRLEHAAISMRCPRAGCDGRGTGQRASCRGRAHRHFGFRGHPVTQSRSRADESGGGCGGWSGLTFTALRARRASVVSEDEADPDAAGRPNWLFVGQRPHSDLADVIDLFCEDDSDRT